MDTLTSELKLVLLCSQVKIREKDLPAIQQLLAGAIDWDLFLNLAEHHRVYPLVYQSLSTLVNSVVPEHVIGVLRKKGWENSSKTLQMTGELVKVLQAMEENGIRTIVLKGFPLGSMLYGNLALRPSRDLDILVWPEDLERARNAVENLGYEQMSPSSVMTPEQVQNWMKKNHHFGYWHRDQEICLELHWRLGHYGLEMPLQEIENSLAEVKIGGQAVCVLGTEEQLLFLILHGAGHAWFRLKWLCDVGVMLRQGAFSWERLYGLSEHLGVEALLNQAVMLALHLLQAPVPDRVVKRITKDRKAQNLVGMALPFISAVDYDPANLRINRPLYFHHKKYQLSILPGWRKKFAYLHNLVLPKDRDIELIPLPQSLYFLYYPLRPFTWFSRQVMQLASDHKRSRNS